MSAIRSLPKDGYNPQGNYNYVSSDSALDRIGKEMAAQGLVIIPTVLDVESLDTQTANGKALTRTRARFLMHIADADGNVFAAAWAGEGIDYGNPDRALNKAMTNATKVFLLKLFVVGAGGDDPDGEATEQPQAQRKPTTAAQRPAAAPATQRQGKAYPEQRLPAKADPGEGIPPGAPSGTEDNPFVEKSAAAADAAPTATGNVKKASQAQLNEMHKLGREAYGAGWDAKRAQLVNMISQGSAVSSVDLTVKECTSLIDGIRKKLNEAAVAVQTPAPAHVANGRA